MNNQVDKIISRPNWAKERNLKSFMSRRKINKPLSKMKQLSLNEMLNLKGGVCVEEYCATVSMLIENNWGNWDDHQREAAANAYATHC